MNNYDRFSLFSPISIRIPKEIHSLIDADARRFGYIKNRKSNINGFLNDLLPSLAAYREATCEAMSDITEINDNLTRKMVNATLSLDNLQLSFIKSSGANISFRANKYRMDEFIDIFDKHLGSFNISFSAFVRNSLAEFVSKRLSIRERLLYFKQFTQISLALQRQLSCFVILRNTTIHFLPVINVVSPYSDLNTIFGIDILNKKLSAIPLCKIIGISLEEKKTTINENVKKILNDKVESFMQNEKIKMKNDKD